MIDNIVSENSLSSLREMIRNYVDDRRYSHILSVEKEAVNLGSIYMPDKIPLLRTAALLHDITKCCSYEKQLQYCEEFGIITNIYDRMQPATLHAMTGAEFAKREFPEFAFPEVISGIRWHTTGHDKMTVFESIIYLADFIEETRTFSDCVELREYFYSSLSGVKDENSEIGLLIDTMLKGLEMTLKSLLSGGEYICSDTVDARNWFLCLKSGNA